MFETFFWRDLFFGNFLASFQIFKNILDTLNIFGRDLNILETFEYFFVEI